MKILFYEWESYLQHDVKEIFKEMKIHVEQFAWKFQNKNEDEKFLHWMKNHIDLSQYDALFSINYWPLLSAVAQEKNIPYIAWCYDNPLNVINIDATLGNAVNTVVFFDYIQAKKYQDAGFTTVHYLPLAVNTSRLSRLSLSEVDRKKYAAEVSFVGSLYESRLHDILAVMDEYSKGYVEAVMNAQQNLYGCYLFDEVITDSFVQAINSKIKGEHPETEFVLLKEALTFAMASEVTRKDRLTLLSLLGKRFDTKLYSFQKSDFLKDVKFCSTVDYLTEMPKVFATSKINLNPSLRCIQSGIPLRALDIMGAGGLLLSNYQPELAEYFTTNEDVVMYESIGDAIEKAEFLLTNEDVRAAIAQNGRHKVLQSFSMKDRLTEILKLAGVGEKEKCVLNLKSNKDFYVMAPAKFASGGPELAHQLCAELMQNGVNAKMYYTAGGNLEPADEDALPCYAQYATKHAVTLDEADKKGSVMVINESASSYIPYFEKAQVAMWWMSVDNYLIDPYKLSEQEIKKYVKYHFVQSAYAYDYVKNILKVDERKIIYLTDYVSTMYSEKIFDDSVRQNVVLFNPKKGYDNLKPLIELVPEVKWVPLINMDREQLRKVMQIAKVYVDFGNHPGKDRLPRETALSGCCIITNKLGSAAYEGDVPIAEMYKFENVKECYGQIKEVILDICNHFSEHTGHFDSYREWIRGEQERFSQETKNMIEKVCEN